MELSLQKKNSNGPEESTPTQVDKYRNGMEKRLKLKAPSQQDKFDKKLGPMKDLKYFISVKDFMEQLGNVSLKKKTSSNANSPDVSIKEQYESARGGFYLQKVEEHLKRNNFRRRATPTFTTELVTDPFCPSEYCNWMENTLNRISPKEEAMFPQQEDGE